MVIPEDVAAAVDRGDLAAVRSWLNNAGPGHVHDCGDVEDYIKWQNVFAGVRAHGSYKRYLRAPHRQFLRLRSLLIRRREERTNRLLLERLRTETGPFNLQGPVWKSAELHLLQRIARLPNGACWKVLSYWREDN